MSDVVLELACGRCQHWWVRWTVDLDRPFDEQLFDASNGERWVSDRSCSRAWQVESPGMYYDDKQWIPTPEAEAEEWSRIRFPCPSGCPSNVQARLDKLERAAVKVLRHLHDTRESLPPVTVDKLLSFVK